MAYIEINSQPTNITTGTTQNISINGYNSSYPHNIKSHSTEWLLFCVFMVIFVADSAIRTIFAF